MRAAARRHAIYFAPATGSAWWRFGCAWLGWDAAADEPRLQMTVPGADLMSLTVGARRYGFHATLKAPFRLASGVGSADLCMRVAQLAQRLAPVPLGALEPALIDGFVALRPSADERPIAALAQTCVASLDDLRAPLSDAELQERAERMRLDARGIELARSFGYPLVLERFRFHITLSDRCSDDDAQRLIAAAALAVAPLNRAHPLRLDRLCVFVESEPQAPLLRLADFPLSGARGEAQADDQRAATSTRSQATSRSSGR